MILIKNATVFTMEEETALTNTDILIEDSKIKHIGKNIKSEGATVIDATGWIVTPGFVDAHSHIGGFEVANGDQDVNEMVKNVTAEMEIVDGINPLSPMFLEALEAGITTSAIAPGSGNVIGGMVAAIKSSGKNKRANVLKKEVAFKAAMGNNPKGVYGSKSQMPMTRMGVAQVLRQYFRDVQEYMKKQEEGKEDPTKMPKFDPAMENGAKVLRKELPVKMHCTQFDMLTVISIAKEFDFNFTLDHAWGATHYLDELEEAKAPILFGPVGVAKGFGESSLIDIDSVVELNRRGIVCSIITDGPVYHPFTLISQTADVVRYGLDPITALKMITINPAKAIGCDDRIGSLKVGKDADLVIFSENPVISPKAYPIYTLIDGEIVFQNQ